MGQRKSWRTWRLSESPNAPNGLVGIRKILGKRKFQNPRVLQRRQSLEKPTRRRYAREYKERMIVEADRCNAPCELGALLRREGLYSGAITRWRRELQESALSSSKKPKRKETPSQEIVRLKRQNASLKEKLRKAELVIDVQN